MQHTTGQNGVSSESLSKSFYIRLLYFAAWISIGDLIELDLRHFYLRPKLKLSYPPPHQRTNQRWSGPPTGDSKGSDGCVPYLPPPARTVATNTPVGTEGGRGGDRGRTGPGGLRPACAASGSVPHFTGNRRADPLYCTVYLQQICPVIGCSWYCCIQ